MMLIAIKMVLLLSSIIIPFLIKKDRNSKNLIIDTDTRKAEYVINEYGELERIYRSDLHIEDFE